MKTITLESLQDSQKQKFFSSFPLERGGNIEIDIKNKSISISTVGGRRVIFNFSEDYEPFIGDFETSFEELSKEVSEAYRLFNEWYKNKTIEDKNGWNTYPLNPWEGFLDTDFGKKILSKILELDFGFWGTSISFSWVSEDDTSSHFYAYCILDLLGLTYTEYEKANLIIDCGELVFPCDW